MQDFEAVYRDCFADVYRYALALCRDRAAAEELTQETFFRALASIGGFRGDGPILAWLFRIARNEFLTQCRRGRRAAPEPLPPPEASPEERAADREAARQLYGLLDRLPEAYRTVFCLRVFGELPFARIGQSQGKTEAWARVVYFRARQKLKEAYDEL